MIVLPIVIVTPPMLLTQVDDGPAMVLTIAEAPLRDFVLKLVLFSQIRLKPRNYILYRFMLPQALNIIEGKIEVPRLYVA